MIQLIHITKVFLTAYMGRWSETYSPQSNFNHIVCIYLYSVQLGQSQVVFKKVKIKNFFPKKHSLNTN